jgi:hypothetical protein
MSVIRVSSVNTAILAAVCVLGFAAAGCDEYVKTTRDPDVRILRGQTWAWRPDTPPVAGPARDRANGRPVVSRDVIPRRDAAREAVARDPEGNNQIVQDRVKNAIQQDLTSSKGLRQVSDPAAADFLIDYHFAVERRNETVQTVYPGAYPGLVCGPYRCWEGWGYGPAAVGYENIRFREGTIVFDMLQQSTQHRVYRAIGQKPVRRDTFSLTQDEINGLVGHLLKNLKTRK